MIKKFDYIDSLRGIAILMVIMVHTLAAGASIKSKILTLLIENICARGVQLFFVLSAFTLFVSYNNRRNKEQKAALNFFIRRFFRIAPMYYLGIFYFLWQNGLKGGDQHWLGDVHSISNENIVSNFLFLHGVSPYWINSLVPGGWSITVEMMFYLFVPLLVKKITTLNNAVSLLIITFFIIGGINYFLSQIHPISSEYLWKDFLNIYFLNQFPVFVCGILVYFLIIKKDYHLKHLQLAGLTILPLGGFLGNTRERYVFVGFFFALFLILLSKKGLKIFVNSFFSFLGKISFSAYLVHFAVIHLISYTKFFNFIPSNTFLHSVSNYILRLGVVLSITSVISVIFYHLIELPGQKLGGNLILWIELRSNRIKKTLLIK